MKKLVLLLLSFGVINSYAQNVIKCYSHENHEEILNNDPQARQRYEALEQYTQDYVKEHPQGDASRATRVIPVVFHIIHQYGAENISKEQILDQIRILNEDFQRLNADTNETPSGFKAIAANANLEFKLAQKDPNGNCTDGIVRVYSPLTNAVNPRDNVKALSYWNSTKYLNIWVVKEIYNSAGGSGIILGYAQFPGSGAAATDGVVLRSDVVGSIGTSSFNNIGRTATHEVGHWLNLRHIWGDANCGSDLVSDTPTHETSNAGCPTYPYNVTGPCNPGPKGEMFTNYMDYTDGNCQNMFSNGQKTRMDAVFNSTRATLISAANLTATGVDGSGPTSCAPKADFSPFTFRTVCEGGSLSFSDISWGSKASSRNWTFAGGSPANDTSKSVTVTYPTAGVYDVSLQVSNSAGSNTISRTGRVIVLPNTPQYTPIYAMDFEDASKYSNDIKVFNEDGDSKTWVRVTNAGYSSSSSLKMDNFGLQSGYKDIFITPQIDLSGGLLSAKVDFVYSYKLKATTSSDVLRVSVSNNCGQSWAPRWTGSASSMAYTTTTQTTAFTPSNNTMWKSQSITIPASYCKSNTLFRFEFLGDNGNNLYIDNINVSGVVGLGNELLIENNAMVVFPNPSDGNTSVYFKSEIAQKGKLKVTDVLGKVVYNLNLDNIIAGENHWEFNSALFNASGVYFVTIETIEKSHVQKFVIN
jgi:PKD repeat protein